MDLGPRGKLKLDSLWVNLLKPGAAHSGQIHPHSVLSGTVYVTTPGGTGSSGVNFTVLTPPNPPAITSFFPTSGQVGAVVTISGANFTGATTLSFGGVPTAFYVNSSSQIAAYVPFGAVSGVITVVTPNGAASSANAFVVVTPVTYAPQISGFTPASGFPGDTVQIQGSSLAAVSSVAFNGVPAAFSIVSDALISATVPQTATTGNLSVTSAQGGATSADIFTVLGTGSGPVITAMSVSNGQSASPRMSALTLSLAVCQTREFVAAFTRAKTTLASKKINGRIFLK